jgi:alpha-galactosidase
MKTMLKLYLGLLALPALAAEPQSVWLADLDLSKMSSGWGKAVVNHSVTTQELTIAGTKFAQGVGTHAESVMYVQLDGAATEFSAQVGVDDHAGKGKGSVEFEVLGEAGSLWQSGVLRCGDAAKAVRVSLAGVKSLVLVVSDGGDGHNNDHADWAEAKIGFTGAKPMAVAKPMEEERILTPPPPAAPRINGPRVYGVRPGHPFLYRIPCTGERPLKFSAQNLPAGLVLDANTGIITGNVTERSHRTYEILLKAQNSHDTAERVFKIVVGDTLALTPPMGWNHWYTHYNRITDELMRQAADVMVSSGMADAGYQYVNIDDCWMNAKGLSKYQTDSKRVGPVRDAAGNIVPNAYFPDMKALTDYVHSKGLKAGTYTSPGESTCAGFGGALGHEAQDAKQFADWGFDFLKYDWCSYGRVAGKKPDLAAMQKPYRLMGDLLKQQNRDIVFNLCQYGMGDVWKWGAEVGGHCWRTAGDLGFELNRIFEVALKNAEHREWSKPGAWNDPDYIQIGWIGAQRGGAFELAKPCPLTPSEQYAFMSLWCLSAAPLFYSGDMGRLEPFTLNVLCNPEVIEVDQDELGQCGRVVPLGPKTFVMVKDMVDGSKAVGLFNRGQVTTRVKAVWSDLGLQGSQRVRDLWRQQDLGTFEKSFDAAVPRRGGVLIRVWPAKP